MGKIKSDFKKCKELKNFRILEIGTKTLHFVRAFKEIIVTMARLQNILLLVLLVTPMIIQITSPGSSLFVKAEEDEVEDEGVEEDEGVVEDEPISEDDEDVALDKNVSPDADTTLFFTRGSVGAVDGSIELPAGKIVEFLVGFANKGENDFVVESLEASFRYPMDFTYHIQNFSAIPYHKTVKPDQQATVAYSFIPADAFAGRPIGLTINLHYRDAAGNFFIDPVFNETVQIVEFDEGFDTETFFMYLAIFGSAALCLFLVFSHLSGKKGSARPGKVVETGTNGGDVDFEWIPKSNLRTPGSGKTSPRQRKSKNNAGSDSD